MKAETVSRNKDEGDFWSSNKRYCSFRKSINEIREKLVDLWTLEKITRHEIRFFTLFLQSMSRRIEQTPFRT